MAYVREFPSLSSSLADNYFAAFDIHAPDDRGPYPAQYDGIGAPSRPPSRTSHNKSPLSNVIDLTAEHAAGWYLCTSHFF